MEAEIPASAQLPDRPPAVPSISHGDILPRNACLAAFDAVVRSSCARASPPSRLGKEQVSTGPRFDVQVMPLRSRWAHLQEVKNPAPCPWRMAPVPYRAFPRGAMGARISASPRLFPRKGVAAWISRGKPSSGEMPSAWIDIRVRQSSWRLFAATDCAS